MNLEAFNPVVYHYRSYPGDFFATMAGIVIAIVQKMLLIGGVVLLFTPPFIFGAVLLALSWFCYEHQYAWTDAIHERGSGGSTTTVHTTTHSTAKQAPRSAAPSYKAVPKSDPASASQSVASSTPASVPASKPADGAAAGTKFCTECGAKNPSTAKFCASCGHKF